jgi:hypothetical protein
MNSYDLSSCNQRQWLRMDEVPGVSCGVAWLCQGAVRLHAQQTDIHQCTETNLLVAAMGHYRGAMLNQECGQVHDGSLDGERAAVSALTQVQRALPYGSVAPSSTLFYSFQPPPARSQDEQLPAPPAKMKDLFHVTAHSHNTIFEVGRMHRSSLQIGRRYFSAATSTFWPHYHTATTNSRCIRVIGCSKKFANHIQMICR